jgi:hypothetical protein
MRAMVRSRSPESASPASWTPDSRASHRRTPVRGLLDPLSSVLLRFFGLRLCRLCLLTVPLPSHHDLTAALSAICATAAALGPQTKNLRLPGNQPANFQGFWGPGRGTAIARVQERWTSVAGNGMVCRISRGGLVLLRAWESAADLSLRTTSRQASLRCWGLFWAVRLRSFVIVDDSWLKYVG